MSFASSLDPGNKVAEFVKDRAVVEVYAKVHGRTFFDIICTAEDIVASKRSLIYFIPSSAIPSLVIVIMEAMGYIADRLKELRDSNGDSSIAVEDDRWPEMRESFSKCSLNERKKLTEFKRGSVVIEVFNLREASTSSFSIRCCREFTAQGMRKREAFIQQRDLRDLVIALNESLTYVERYSQAGESSEEISGNLPNVSGGFYEE